MKFKGRLGGGAWAEAGSKSGRGACPAALLRNRLLSAAAMCLDWHDGLVQANDVGLR